MVDNDQLSVDQNDPIDVVDRQLWRDARDMIQRHVAATVGSDCDCCGRPWPCTSRRAGERAEMAAFMPFDEAWTVRVDLQTLRAAEPARRTWPASRHGGAWRPFARTP